MILILARRNAQAQPGAKCVVGIDEVDIDPSGAGRPVSMGSFHQRSPIRNQPFGNPRQHSVLPLAFPDATLQEVQNTHTRDGSRPLATKLTQRSHRPVSNFILSDKSPKECSNRCTGASGIVESIRQIQKLKGGLRDLIGDGVCHRPAGEVAVGHQAAFEHRDLRVPHVLLNLFKGLLDRCRGTFKYLGPVAAVE